MEALLDDKLCQKSVESGLFYPISQLLMSWFLQQQDVDYKLFCCSSSWLAMSSCVRAVSRLQLDGDDKLCAEAAPRTAAG